MKKTISILIVSLLAAALLLVACKAPAATVVKPSESQPAANGTVGGWTVFDDSTAYPIPDKAMDAFNRATDGYVGVTFKPIALIGTQVVAGTNYSIRCLATPVVQNPVSHLAVVTVYEDVSGNATIKNTVDFNLGQIKDAETGTHQEYGVVGHSFANRKIILDTDLDLGGVDGSQIDHSKNKRNCFR